MSLLDWFSPRKKPEARHSALPSSGLSRMDSTRPVGSSRGLHATAQPANRKQERLARRELLYGVVREAMLRAGVLTTTYKFKVLSLDPRGRQFLVMVDLAQGEGGDTARLAEIEAMVAQAAKQRHDILVTALYWRVNEHVAVGDPATRQQHAISALKREAIDSSPGALTDLVSRPAELHPAPPTRVEPVRPEEVAALQRAPGASAKGEQALAAVASSARPHEAHSYTLLTGFEDTEMASGEPEHNLSGTQYGELR